MSDQGVLLVCSVDELSQAQAVLGVVFVFGDARRVSWFATPLPLMEAVEVVGPFSEGPDGVRLVLVDVARGVSPVNQPMEPSTMCGGG